MAVTIPRFLLPQLTWRDAVQSPNPLASAVILSSLPSRPRPRTISSQAWRPHKPISPPTSTSYVPWTRLSIPNGHVPFPSGPIRRTFHTTPPLYRDHHFDTLKFVQRLKEEGFSEEQAIAMMRVLSDVIEESIQNLTRTMVLREGTFFLFLTYSPPLNPSKQNLPHLTPPPFFKKTPNAPPTPKKSTSPSSGPSSSPPTPPKPSSPVPPTSA